MIQDTGGWGGVLDKDTGYRGMGVGVLDKDAGYKGMGLGFWIRIHDTRGWV